MKWLPRLALAARRELTSCNLAQAPLRTQAPFVKDAWRSQTLTYHVYAAEVWGVGVGRARINHSRDTTYRSIPANQKAPCCGEFPWNARGPLPLTFGGGRCCFITATGKDGVGWCQRVRISFPIMPTPPGPPEAELFQDLCVSQLPVDAEGRQGWK